MRVPIPNVIKPKFVMPEYLFLLGGPMWPEGESSSAVARPWSGRDGNLPIMTANPREKLSAGLALIEASLTVSIEHRQRLRVDADSDPLHLKFHYLVAHGNVQSPS